jgi:hypothetical protein
VPTKEPTVLVVGSVETERKTLCSALMDAGYACDELVTWSEVTDYLLTHSDPDVLIAADGWRGGPVPPELQNIPLVALCKPGMMAPMAVLLKPVLVDQVVDLVAIYASS